MASAETSKGATHRLSLGSLDADLERRFQREAGAESLNGYRTIASRISDEEDAAASPARPVSK